MKLKISLPHVCKYLVLTLFLLSAIEVSSQIQGSTINGMVFSPDRRGLSEIDVELLDEYSRLVGRTRTESGRFTFRGLTAGVFRIRVMAQRQGYVEQTQEVQIVSISRSSSVGPTNDSVYVDFYLQPYRNPSLAESMGINSVIFVQEVPKEAEKFYQQALTDFDKKNDDSAINNLKKAIETFPKYYVALTRLGEEMMKRQDYKSAEQIFSKAVEVNAKGADAYYLLGYSQYVSKKFDSSVVSLRQAVTWSPKSAAAYLLLGMALRQTSKYTEAETQMLKAKDLSKKKLPDVHFQLALLYAHNLKKYTEAANELELFLKAQPDTKDAESIKKLIKQFREKAAQNSNS